MLAPTGNNAQVNKVGSSLHIEGAKEALPTSNKLMAIAKGMFKKVQTIEDPATGKSFKVNKSTLAKWIKNNPDFKLNKSENHVTIQRALLSREPMKDLSQLIDRHADNMEISTLISQIRSNAGALKRMTREDLRTIDTLKENSNSKIFNALEGLRFDILSQHPNLSA